MVKKFKHSFTLYDCLFEAVKLTKIADPDKYGKSGYSIGFENVNFATDNTSSVHTDDRRLRC